MKIKVTSIVIACMCILFSGCAAKMMQKMLDEPYRTKSVSVDLTIDSVEFVDARQHTDTAHIYIPRATFKKISGTINPPLSEDHKKIIIDEIAHYTKANGVHVKVRATIKDGYKEYLESFCYGREYTHAIVTIEILDSLHQPNLYSASGEAEYEIKSIGIDVGTLEKLYVKTLKTCVYKSFESIGEFIK